MNRCIVVLLAALASGCATGPYTPMNSCTMKGDKVIYFEQADRIPKDVMLESWKHQPVANFNVTNGPLKMAIPPEIIAEIIKEVLAAIPEITKGYQTERMNESLLSRRMFFRGYGTNELADINDIVQSMGWCIEYMTPQNKTVPPPQGRPVPAVK